MSQTPRLEPTTAKVLRATAEIKDLTPSELLELIVISSFRGKCPFDEKELHSITRLQAIYGSELAPTSA